MPKETKTEKAIRRVRNLIENLRASTGKIDVEPFSKGGLLFLDRRLGGLRMDGREAEHYRQCLEGLTELQGNNPDLRVTSYHYCVSFPLGGRVEG